MKKNKEVLITTIILIIVLGILAVSDVDYSISTAIINRESLFGEFFNLFGELPATFGMLLAVTLLYGGRRKDILWRNILGVVVSLPFMFLFSYYVCIMPIRYIYEFSESGIPRNAHIGVLIAAAVLFVCMLLLIRKVGNKQMRGYRRHAFVLLLLIVLEMVLVNVLKIVWARPRMRSIESFDQFRHWYEIGGPMNSEEFKSFPSGHTANGFVMIVYTIFISAKGRKWTHCFTAFAVIWGISTALSRVILGAHFLSDVAVGGYITMLLFYVLRGKLLKEN